MRRSLLISLIIAIVLGSAAAWFAYPAWQIRHALRGIASQDPMQRDAGWARLVVHLSPAGSARAHSMLDRIINCMNTASDKALLHAGDVLRGYEQWDWNRIPPALLIRDITIRFSLPDPIESIRAAGILDHTPSDLDEQTALELFNLGLGSSFETVQRITLDAAIGWAGLDRLPLLNELKLPYGEAGLHRRTWLARSWTDSAIPPQKRRLRYVAGDSLIPTARPRAACVRAIGIGI